MMTNFALVWRWEFTGRFIAYNISGAIIRLHIIGFFTCRRKKRVQKNKKVVIIWTVHHLWPYGACFIFNCYRHWYSLILHNGNGTSRILHSRVGVIKGDPLGMVDYWLGVLPLIKNVKSAHHDVIRTWYADNVGVIGMFRNIENYFNFLTQAGTYRGYLPEPTKIVLIVHPDNI